MNLVPPAKCPVCGDRRVVRLPSDWPEGAGVEIVGCGNPWHYVMPPQPKPEADRPVDREAAALGPLWLSIRYEIALELIRATAKHGPMNSPHEAYAVILEELDEFWECVRAWNATDATTERNPRHELIQIAAMAVRAIRDLKL
jgi:hypothetical protein